MAISSAGIGSGLNVAEIVEKMVAAEKTPLKKLETRADGIRTQISTYGEIKSLTSTLGDIVSKMTRDSAWNAVNISSSNSTISGTMTGIASPGTYNIKVTQLAQAQTSLIGGGADALALAKNEAMGSNGKMLLTVGTVSKEIDVSSTDTLTKIAAKLNEAGLGVQASVVTDVDGKERLMLRSQKTGADGSFSLEIDAGQTGTGLQAKLGVKEAQAAKNAVVELNGVTMESSSNTFANTLPGMSFTVSEVTTNPATLTVKLDTESMKKNIKDFVDAYNALNDLLAKSTKAVRTEDGKVDTSAQTNGAGVLQGDSGTVSLQNSLRMLTMGVAGGGGAFKHLSDIGIQMLEGGKLSVDETKLDKGLASVDDLKKLFAQKADAQGQNGGIAVNFKSLTDKLLAYEGTLNNKSDALDKSLKSNAAEQTKVNDRALALEERLYKQYSALDVKMSSLTALNSYVSQMVTTWNKSSS